MRAPNPPTASDSKPLFEGVAGSSGVMLNKLCGTTSLVINSFQSSVFFMVKDEPGIDVGNLQLSERCVLTRNCDWSVVWIAVRARVVPQRDYLAIRFLLK